LSCSRRPIELRHGRAARLGELKLLAARCLSPRAERSMPRRTRRTLAVAALGVVVGFGGDLELAGRHLAEQELGDRRPAIRQRFSLPRSLGSVRARPLAGPGQRSATAAPRGATSGRAPSSEASKSSAACGEVAEIEVGVAAMNSAVRDRRGPRGDPRVEQA
jgi:hypothetical protein